MHLSLLAIRPALENRSISQNMQPSNHSSTDIGQPLNSAYQFDEQKGKTSSMENSNHTNTGSVAGQIPPTTQDYSAYAAYQPSMNSYAYPDYQNYYYAYQTPANDSTYQQAGGTQNTGAPYQSLSSFQNASSYMGPTSYSGTYFNPGDYQTTPGYQAAAGFQAPPAYQMPAEYPSSNYSNQANLWNGGNSGSYSHHEYSSYPALDTSRTHNGAAVNPVHYQQPYNQWDGYYPQNDSNNVLCPPGTEKISTTNNSTVENANLTVISGHLQTSSQPPPPGTTSWKQDTSSSGISLQAKDVTTGNSWSIYWNKEPTNQNQNVNQTKSYFQTPSNCYHPSHDPSNDQQKIIYSESSNLSFPLTNPVSQTSQTVSQNTTTKDACQISKVQIPTNPKIASNLAISVTRTCKESPVTTATAKPAYISVAAPKLGEKVPSHETDESAIKGAIPPSLRAYVERTFARCNDDSQRAANQNIMKEIITNASADGTLLTRDWDAEAIFPLPNATVDTAEKKKSPGRRTKSRWEPIRDVKLVENLQPASHTTPKQPIWNQFKGSEKALGFQANHLQPATANCELNQSGWNKINFVPAQQQAMLAKNVPGPFKRQRFDDVTTTATATESGNISSDSDKDQDLAKYYSTATALANSPGEKKKRENRFKRFERGQEHLSEEKKNGAKNAASRSLYTRRNALFLAKNYEEKSSRAVEDIDWDSLTVKGTCQEIEKRYLRLTSAPDPTTVRPEDVLEKALGMVQNSIKNYLYKCDQLKSIRQDLTVQRIRNELTVKVYETHARLSLEAGDMAEYNQCQSQLKSLYAEGIKGCCLEFSAYNLLCVIVHSSNKRELLSSMSRLPVASKDNEAVKHALAVRAAVMSGNYVHFFRLYKKAPNMNTCFMDLYVETMRFEAVNCMCKSYRPVVPILYISHILGFSKDPDNTGDATDGLDECEDWLRAHGAILLTDNFGERQLDTKASFSTLFKPDPEDAVAHGDASLAVDDFLTRTL